MTESEGKGTGWKAFYRTGEWEALKKAPPLRKTHRKKTKAAKKKTKTAKKTAKKKSAGTPSAAP